MSTSGLFWPLLTQAFLLWAPNNTDTCLVTFPSWPLVSSPLAFPVYFQSLQFWFFISLLVQHILNFLTPILIFLTWFLDFTIQLSPFFTKPLHAPLHAYFFNSEDSSSELSAPSFPSGFPVEPREELTPSHTEPSPDRFLLTRFSLSYWFSVQFLYFFLPRLQVPFSFSLPPTPHSFAFQNLLKFCPLCQFPKPSPLVPILLFPTHFL